MRYVALLLIVLALATMKANPKCPEDDSNSYFTGRTRTSSVGYVMYEYKCMMFGHLFWAKSR